MVTNYDGITKCDKIWLQSATGLQNATGLQTGLQNDEPHASAVWNLNR